MMCYQYQGEGFTRERMFLRRGCYKGEDVTGERILLRIGYYLGECVTRRGCY